MHFKVEDTSTYKDVFWSNFICTIFFNIFSLFSVLNLKYSDKYKNKLQIIGTLLGLLASFMFYPIITFLFCLKGIFRIIAPCLLAFSLIIYIIIVRKIAKKKGL